MMIEETGSVASDSGNEMPINKILHDHDVVRRRGGNSSGDESDEQLVFDPFNAENTEITLSEVQSILTRYGVPGKVHNMALYKRAFIHKSYVKRPHIENARNNITIVDQPEDCMPLKTKSNERLEFLGDGVLECIIKYYLYRRFPKENEGFMTEKKIALVKNEHIGKLAYEMGLHKWYILSKHAEEKKTRTNYKKLGCLFEAFLGALFLDFNKIQIHDDDKWFDRVFVTGPGFQIAQTFIEAVFEKHVNWVELIKNDDNYKNILQVMIQKEFKVTPTYLLVKEDEETGYHVGVYLAMDIPVEHILPQRARVLEGEAISFSDLQERRADQGSLFVCLAQSSHKIKKKAEQQACEIAITRIRKGNAM